jgi:chemotaxis signal transduction protein
MRNNSIDITGLILQAISLIILLQDYNNKDLMRELQNQDEKYLKKIIEQNDEILLILRERK